ncbi:MAG: PIG-L family deacetylase [Myxococcales bacterium]|nr:PIG-L family deacetylase [Myxococcales bacterium]
MIVSPHLDDGVLSLGGWIAARALAGDDVVVLTVCSEGDASYAERRAEDVAAVTSLGAAAVHLGVADAPFRRGAERSFRGLILAALEDDDADAGRVIAAIVARVGELAADTALLPLGVGEHVDHRIVHAAQARLAGRVGFYADRPYADVRHAVRARLARLGARVEAEAAERQRSEVVEREEGDALVAAFMASARAAAYVRAYVPEREREACLRPLAEPLRRPSPARGLALVEQTHRLTAELRGRAARAVQMYASQVGDLFGGAAEAGSRYAADVSLRLYWRRDG